MKRGKSTSKSTGWSSDMGAVVFQMLKVKLLIKNGFLKLTKGLFNEFYCGGW